MEVGARFRRSINSLYSRLGVIGEYWPADGGVPEEIRLIVRRPDRFFELGEAQIHAEDPQFEFRAEEVPSPQRGDDIHLGDMVFRIEAEPRLEQHQLVWVVDALPL